MKFNFLRKRGHTKGAEGSAVVLGSKEKICIIDGEEGSLLPGLPNATKFAFSGCRIHDPHVALPRSGPTPSITVEAKLMDREFEQ